MYSQDPIRGPPRDKVTRDTYRLPQCQDLDHHWQGDLRGKDSHRQGNPGKEDYGRLGEPDLQVTGMNEYIYIIQVS
jgi:hypothetical protein